MKFDSLKDKKMKRKNFFVTIGIGAASLVALKSMPFKLFSKKSTDNKIENSKISRIKVNPLAVSRKKIGDNNA
jgi:hypothetical protein